MKSNNNNKKVAIIVLITAIIGFSNSIMAADPIVLRFAHSASPESPKGKMATRFQQLVKDNVGDSSVVVEVYPNGILFDDEQLAPAVFKNRVQLIATPIANLRPYSRRIQLFDLPFLFVTERAASRFLRGDYGQRLLRLVNRHGANGLGYLENGMKQISATTKIVNPNDAKNVKFLIADSKISDVQFRKVGARPIVGNLHKIVPMLQSNVVDAQESTWSNMYTREIYPHQAFILESNHVYLADMIMASKQGWSAIPENIRKRLEDQLAKAIEYGNALALQQAKNEKNLILESQQTEITQMTVDQRELWVDAMKDVWEQFSDEIGADLINAAASAR